MNLQALLSLVLNPANVFVHPHMVRGHAHFSNWYSFCTLVFPNVMNPGTTVPCPKYLLCNKPFEEFIVGLIYTPVTYSR